MKPLAEHQAGVPERLAAYFSAMEDVVFAGRSPDELRAALGETPSSNARFDFYRQLASANPRRTLKGTFRASQRLCDRHRHGLFDELVERHFAARPPSGWELTRVCEDFESTVAAAAEDGVELPNGLDEVVDYETLRQRILFFELEAPTPGAPHPAAEVRSYSFDVPAFAVAVRQAEDVSEVHPSGGAVTCLFHRDPETGRLRTRTPSVPHLVALAIASGDADESVLPEAGMSTADLSAAREELYAWGALVPA